jgi:hypothetical protein
MKADLQEQIREFIDRGARPVSVSEIASHAPAGLRRPARQPARPAHRYGRSAAIAAGVVAIGCAAAITASQLTGPGTSVQSGHRAGVLLTTAMVRQVASASRTALGPSGRAQIAFRDTIGGVLQDWGTDDIRFSGQNYNLVLRERLPAADGAPASTQSAVNRVVNGQAYDYFVGSDGLRWYHGTGPDAVADLSIPDPRTLLATLEPSARFELVGYQVIGGVRVEHLRAADPGRLSGLGAIRQLQAGPHVTALDVWADSRGVVRQIGITAQRSAVAWAVAAGLQLLRQQLREFFRLAGRGRTPAMAGPIVPGPGIPRLDLPVPRKAGLTFRREIQATTMLVRFLDIGRPQAITVPPHAINVYGRG